MENRPFGPPRRPGALMHNGLVSAYYISGNFTVKINRPAFIAGV